MSSAGESNVTPRHSVFISYASDDRGVVRALRDALNDYGLEVWFDENELGGGDAWDQKIRRQIRDCDYFLPVISAATERRKEGYFRREWRLAVERTMDMADDVLFLVPIVIDDTSESRARVPDKFLAVQWLRVPGGVPNENLQALARRMLAGDHRTVPVLNRTATGNTNNPAAPSSAANKTQPPFLQAPEPVTHTVLHMPPFPHPPAKDAGFSGGVKFFAEVIWWGINSFWSLLQKLPRWARILILIYIVFACVTRVGRLISPSPEPTDRNFSSKYSGGPQSPQFRRAMKKANDAAALGHKGENRFDPKAIAAAAQTFVNSLDDAADKQVAVIPFTAAPGNEAHARTVDAIFTAVYGKLALDRSDDIGVVKQPPPTMDDAALIARGEALDSRFMLSAVESASSETPSLVVRLLRIKDGSVAWTGTYPLNDADPTMVGNEIARGVLGVLPKK